MLMHGMWFKKDRQSQLMHLYGTRLSRTVRITEPEVIRPETLCPFHRSTPTGSFPR
jgi:hypothetical protein